MANVITAKQSNVITAKQPNVITAKQPSVITPIKPVVTPVKPIIPSIVLKTAEPIAIKPAVIQQANMELSNGRIEQALNTLKSAEQEAVNGLSKQPQGSTETKGEPSWPDEPEPDDTETEPEPTDTGDQVPEKPSNLKWWLIGGGIGLALIIAVIIIIVLRKRK